MNRLRSIWLLTAFWTILAAPAFGQAHRYWYDKDCHYRFDATVVGLEQGGVRLQGASGRSVFVPIERLSESDQVYVEVIDLAARAVAAFDRSPYSTADVRCEHVATWLAEQGISARAARSLAASRSERNDRSLFQIVGRWIEINGIPYEIAEAPVSETANGIERLVVRIDKRRTAVIWPNEFPRVALLPNLPYRTRPDLRPGDGNPFYRRGPVASPAAASAEAHEELVYDPAGEVWTDRHSAQGHNLLLSARGLRESSRYMERVASSRWNVHRGNRLYAVDRFDEAEAHYTQAISEAPEFAEAYFRRGLARIALEKLPLAIADLDTAIAQVVAARQAGGQPPGFLAEAYAARAGANASLHAYQSAIADAESAVRLGGDSAATHVALLKSIRTQAMEFHLERARRFLAVFESNKSGGEAPLEAAIAQCDQAIEYNPDASVTDHRDLRTQCTTLLAENLAVQADDAARRSNFLAATTLVRRAISLAPGDDKNGYSEKLALYEQKLEAQRDAITRSCLRQAQAALASNQFDQASLLVDEALKWKTEELEPQVKELAFTVYSQRAGRLHLPAGRNTEAVDDLTRAIEFKPDDAAALLLRGFANYQLGHYDQAITDETAAIKADSDQHQAYFIRALSQAARSKSAEAVADLSQAISLDGANAHYFYHRAVHRGRLGETQTALADITQAIALDGSVAAYFELRAMYQDRLGNSNGAFADAEQALAMNPSSGFAHEIRGRITEQRRLQAEQQWRFEEEQRRSDPFYVDEEALPRAAIKIAAALVGELIAEDGRQKLNQAETLEEGIAAGLQMLAGRVGSEWAIDSAISDAMPNLNGPGRVALKVVISQLATAVATGQFDARSLVIGGTRQGLEDGVQEWLKTAHPNYQHAPQVVSLLAEICVNLPRNN